LHRVLIDERTLDRVEPLAVAEPLDGHDAVERGLLDAHEARRDGTSVGEHEARAALAAAAAVSGRGQPEVVAEGVETAAEWNEVAELGCDAVQGYFISRPVTGDALCAWAVPLARALAGAHSPVVLSAPN